VDERTGIECPLKVSLIGSGGSAVSAKRACPCIVVNDSIVFDMGPGALRNLRRSDLQLEGLAVVFISHTHADHVSDLIPFLWAVQIDGRRSPLKVYGPPGFKEIVRNLLECTRTPEDFFKFPLTISEIDFGRKVSSIRTCRTSHSIPTLAFRIDMDGRSFCYSADTIYCPAVIELGHNVDLLMHEATFLEDQLATAEVTSHSTARMAGQAAKEANAEKLVLFHIPPPNEHREKEFSEEAQQGYGSQVILGKDMTTIEM